MSKTQNDLKSALLHIEWVRVHKELGLNLHNGNLDTLPVEIAELSHLEELVLSRNSLSMLPPEIGQLTNLRTLDLTGNVLTDLPAEIGMLQNLTTLILARSKLKRLPPEIGKLKNLEILILTDTHLRNLPPEITQLSKLTTLQLSSYELIKHFPIVISQLGNLKRLEFYLNAPTKIPKEIGQLKNLEVLDLSTNRITTIPPQIGEIKNLESLDLGENMLQEIPKEIFQIESLTSLNLRDNALSNIPAEVGQLNNLKHLDLRKNNLESLPIEILKLKKLEILLLHNNKLDIPAELLGEENWLHQNGQRILAYLKESFDSERWQLNETKMLVVGQGGVGKTSLIQRLIEDRFEEQSKKTEGINIRQLNLDLYDREVKLNIWDFGGQEVMHATHQFFLTQRSLYVLVLSARSDLEANKPYYWLNLIEQYGGSEVPIILVINKIDDNPILDFNETAIKRKFNIKAIIRTSCRTAEGVGELEKAIELEISRLPHVSDTIPGTWFSVKESLEKEKKIKDILDFDSYIKLCGDQSIGIENRPTLLNLLHDLGTIINYHRNWDNPVFEEIQILNPQWVTDGVYAIINSQDIFEEKGVLHRSKVGKILADERYKGFVKQEFILGMMEQFELAFPFENKTKYLIPDLLPESEQNIRGFESNTHNFEYRYPTFIPPSVFSRFIVRQHGRIKYQETELWKNGVVIYFDGLRALVREEKLSKKILIVVEGDSNRRRELLAIIRSTFDAIHGSFAKLKVRAMVPILGEEDAAVSYKALLAHEADSKSEIYVEDIDEFVEISPLLSGVDGPKSNRELLQLVKTRFSKADLNELLFEMGIDYEIVDGSDRGKSEYAVELLRFLQRQEMVERFLAEMKKSRGDLQDF